MGLFHQNFDKPGPGVSPNAPRKKGAARYFEVLARDFSTFWMAGLLAMISSLPFALGLWFAVTTHSLIPMLLAGILGGMLAAPQIVGLNDTVLRALRDEPGYWWVTYRRAWKRNAKAALLPGAICGLLLAMEIFTAFHTETGSVAVMVAIFVALILLAGIAVPLRPGRAGRSAVFQPAQELSDALFGVSAPQRAGHPVAGPLLGRHRTVLAAVRCCADPDKPLVSLLAESAGHLPRLEQELRP